MSFQAMSEQSLDLLPYPHSRLLAGLFGVAPAEPGIYGEGWTETILVTTNYLPALAALGQNPAGSQVTALALDAGGFSPASAAAFGIVSLEQARQALAASGKNAAGSSRQLLIPRALAAHWGFNDNVQIDGWPIRVVADDLSKLVLRPEEAKKHIRQGFIFPPLLQRLVTGLALWLGQALICAVPLAVFGWPALLQGLTALLLGAILLALGWSILPGRGWLKGLILGGTLALTVGFFAVFVVHADWRNISMPLLGLFTAATWMGIVFMGAKP